MSYTYEYPRPAVTADCAVLRRGPYNLEVLLIRRAHPPFQDRWALPGGFVEPYETIESAAHRELQEETGLRRQPDGLVDIFSTVDRDPRGRTISAVYYFLTDGEIDLSAGSDAGEVGWFAFDHPPALAFDHDEIIARTAACLRERARSHPIVFCLLPDRFNLEAVHETMQWLTGNELDRQRLDGFLRETGILIPVKPEEGTYRLDPERLRKMNRDGWWMGI